MIYVPAEAMPASVFAALHSRATGQSSISGTILLDRESSYKRLSLLALDPVASLASHAYVERLFSLCGDLTARKPNSTMMSLCKRISLKLNRHILH